MKIISGYPYCRYEKDGEEFSFDMTRPPFDEHDFMRMIWFHYDNSSKLKDWPKDTHYKLNLHVETVFHD